MQLVKYDAARYALQEARSVDEVKDVRDKAEALRLYARQAHDKDMELWTAEIKLRAIRRIGELSASLETAQGARTELLPAAGTKLATLEAAGISKSAANRYEQVAAMPEEDLERYIADKQEAREPVSVTELLAPRPHVSNNSGNNEWYTPPEFIAAARRAMGAIDLDPASSAIANATIGASAFYTAAENGLKQPWRGSVWLNPPYAQPLIADFCEAVSAKFASGEIGQACVLVNNATETAWFQRLLEVSSAVCLPRGRVRFLDPAGNPGAPLQGQAVIYMGPRVSDFASAFASFGAVLSHVE